jgi:Leucine-rich repeat (LRR) protein
MAWIQLFVLCCVHVAFALNVHWCPKQCDCYNQYTVVDCSERGLTSLPQFSNLTVRLYLENNLISELPDDGFSNTPHLVVITLHNNHLHTVNTASFCGLSKLEELNLSGNEISSFTVDQDCEAPSLHLLELQRNHLYHSPTNLSRFAPNLLTLNLSHNELESVAFDESYQAMSQLRHLEMSVNNFHKINPRDLDSLSSTLQVLHMSDCGLVYINPAALERMKNLTELSLASNLLTSINIEEMFARLGNDSKLQALDLSHMFLPNITVKMIGMLGNLIDLDLSDSSIEEIDANLWPLLPHLERLNLDNNDLRSIKNLAPLTQLIKLHLSHNQLQEVAVRRLFNLELLDLSYNNINHIPDAWMANTDIIFTLNLSNNALTTVSPHAFQDVNMRAFDLSYNALTTLHSFGHVKLSKLYLHHNQLAIVTADAFHQLDVTLEDLDLSYNNLSQFTHYPFREFLSLQSLNLAYNDLGASLRVGGDKMGDFFASLSHLQVLNLAHNGITSLPHQQLQHLHHLTTLYLQENHIADLLDLSLPDAKSLAKLVVADNRLSTVEPAVLTSLEYLEVIDLSNNPYDCSCHLLHFLHWLNSTLVTVLFTDVPRRYQCSRPDPMRGKYILNYRPHAEDCLQYDHIHLLQHNITFVAIAIGSLFLFGLLLTLVLYYGQICQRIKSLQYRWQVRYREVSGVEIAGDPKV